MGSYHGTCAITNLPIYEGERTVLVLLTETSKTWSLKGGMSNPNDLFEPLCTPLHGVYNDYGCIREVEDESGNILPMIQKLCKKGEILVQNPEDDNFLDSLDSFLKEVGRGNVSIQYIGKEYPVYFTLILQSSYDYFIQEGKQFRDWRGNFYERTKRELEEYIIPENRLLSPAITPFSFDFITYNFKTFSHHIKQILFQEEEQILREKYTELYLLNELFVQSRKHWSIQSGAGSDNSSWEWQQKIAKHTLQTIEEKKKHFDDDDYDE